MARDRYLIDITNEVSYDSVSSISLTLSGDTGLTISSSRVIPKSFTYSSSTSEVSVLAQNTGDFSVSLVGGFHKQILLDSADQALDFSYLDASSSYAVSPGGSDPLTDTLIFYGNASRMVVVVDFDGTGTAGALTVAPKPEDVARLEAVRAYKSRVRDAWAARN